MNAAKLSGVFFCLVYLVLFLPVLASTDLERLHLFPFPDPLLFDAELLFLPDVSATASPWRWTA